MAQLLHTNVSGSGPTLVMVHGFLSSSQYFRRLVTEFEREYTVVRVDLLGHGKSPNAPDYSLKSHVEALHATLESLQLERPYTFVAHSMGALVALEYARRFPNDIRRLALLNPPIFAGSIADAIRSIRATGKLYRGLLLWRHRRLLWRLIKLAPRLQHPRRQPINSADVLRVPRQAREQGLREIILPSNLFAALDTLNMPTLVVTGERDRAIYRENLAGWRPPKHISLRITPHGHHFPIFQRTEAVQTIRHFLEV